MDLVDLPKAEQPLEHSEFRPPFLSIPLEIRFKILRYLVLGEGKVYPQYPRAKWATQYHMRIFETCSQLYEEASTIFYAENTIGYQCLIDDTGAWKPVESCLPQKNLARIRHVQLAIYPWKLAFTGKALSLMLGYLLRTGCSLQTLKLRFYISNTEDPKKRSDLAAGKWRRGRRGAIDRLCALKVQQTVEVFVTTGNVHDGDEFEDFLDVVAAIRGWKVELRKHEVHKDPYLAGVGHLKDHDTLHEWTWLLLPIEKSESKGL